MSKLEKLIEEIMEANKDLRFEELAKVLVKLGYSQNQPKGGSSHYIFRKPGFAPISLKKDFPMDVAYIKIVREILTEEGF